MVASSLPRSTQHSPQSVWVCVRLFILQLAAKSMVDASRILALALVLVERRGEGDERGTATAAKYVVIHNPQLSFKT